MPVNFLILLIFNFLFRQSSRPLFSCQPISAFTLIPYRGTLLLRLRATILTGKSVTHSYCCGLSCVVQFHPVFSRWRVYGSKGSLDQRGGGLRERGSERARAAGEVRHGEEKVAAGRHRDTAGGQAAAARHYDMAGRQESGKTRERETRTQETRRQADTGRAGCGTGARVPDGRAGCGYEGEAGVRATSKLGSGRSVVRATGTTVGRVIRSVG